MEYNVFRSQPAPASLKAGRPWYHPPLESCFPEPTGSGLIEGGKQVKNIKRKSSFSGANRLRPH